MPRKTTQSKSLNLENKVTSEIQPFNIDFLMLQELVNLLEKSQLTELEIDTGVTRVWLSKNQPLIQSSFFPQTVPINVSQSPISTTPISTNVETKTTSTSSSLVEVRSPMVGTFYAAPSPDAEPYVKVGDFVREGQILCIIEAMKLMNEIESEVSGKVVEISVKNGQPVEFNAVLFRIEPSV
ncbi:MAG: acetyl-CoA carboxylase biotin carboxyl carrier protein [bacterium]|nr:acetyl-CoA carboxylase biotin carboxyl carrier protein [bacterium]